MSVEPVSNHASFLDNSRRIGGIAGIAFVVLFIVGAVAQGDSPSYGDSAPDIRKFFTDNANQYVVGQWITAVGVVFGLLPFSVILRRALAKVDNSDGLWATLAFIGALVWTALAGANTAALNSLALTKAQGMDDSTLLNLIAIDDVGFTLAGLGLGLLTLSASIVILRTGVFWRWLAVLGFIATALTIVGDLSALHHGDMGVLDGVGGIGYVGSALFILFVSINLLRMERPVLVAP